MELTILLYDDYFVKSEDLFKILIRLILDRYI